MKPKSNFKYKMLPVVFLGCFSFTLLAWDFKDHHLRFLDDQQKQDTIPKTKDGRDRKIRDLDDVLNELERSKLDVEASMKNVDWEKINREIKESLKNIDGEKIRLEIEKAMKEIDFEKISKEVEASMAKIDWKKMEQELEHVKKMDFSKLEIEMKQVAEEMKKIGPALEKELAEVKKMDFSKLEADMKKLEIEMKEMKPKLEKELANAKIEIDKLKEDIKEYKSFVDGLNKDGLINKKEEYTIEHRDGELIINGKTQPASIYNKYRSFLEKHKKFSLKKNDDDFNIDMD